MSREKVLFKSEERKTRDEVSDTLHLFAERIKQGRMSLKSETRNVDLEFPGTLTLEIKAEEEKKRRTKRSLEIEIEWIVGEEGQGGLSIE